METKTTKQSVQSVRWLNPAMLRWARLWRGKTIEEAAVKLKKKPEVIEGWEEDRGTPTVNQARVLADFYERAFLEFLLPSPPKLREPKAIPDFRMHTGVLPPADSWEIKDIRQWAEAQRENAIDLFGELGELPTNVPNRLFDTVQSNPDVVARRARATLGFSIQDQMGLGRGAITELPNILRGRLETIGLLTLRHSGLKQFGIRGICLALFPLPVIVFSNEAPSAQAFTLAHEFGHVLIRESGITGARSASYDTQPIEQWCDRFAASFLMPRQQVAEYAGERPVNPDATIEDGKLKNLARIFGVSPHAMLIRLVHLGYVEEEYYWNTKKPEFDLEEEAHKPFGRPKYYGHRYETSLGDLYTGLVLEAWSSGHITNHNAAEYMGIKNLSHLNDIRDGFGQ